MATQRRQPTVSPSIGTDSAQTISGMVKSSAPVTVSGRNCMAKKLVSGHAQQAEPAQHLELPVAGAEQSEAADRQNRTEQPDDGTA